MITITGFENFKLKVKLMIASVLLGCCFGAYLGYHFSIQDLPPFNPWLSVGGAVGLFAFLVFDYFLKGK